MSQMNLVLAIAGALILAVGLFSEAMKRTPVSVPMIAVALGVAVGPVGLDLIDLAGWGDAHAILEQAARVMLAVGLMAIALRLSPDDFRTLARPAAVLLTLVMIGMCLSTAAVAHWMFALPLWSAVLVGAVLTPTDPIVSSSIVTGKFAKETLPARVRAALSLESGANDGLAYVLVLLPLLVLGGTEHVTWRWFVEGLVLGVVIAAALGAGLGMAAARLVGWARRKQIIESYSVLTFTLALTLFTLGAARLLGADALISVFVAGIAFNLMSDTDTKQEEENVQEAINQLITPAIFALFGAALPWQDWADIGWPLAAFAVAVLLLRRPPVFLVLSPVLRGRLDLRDLAYLGWFGPIGISAVYYALFSLSRGADTLVWHLASAVVVASVFAHGLSAAPLSRLAFGSRGPSRSWPA